jgi:hypothetical protein
MKKILCTAAAAALLVGSGAWAQTHTSTQKATTSSNGQVTSTTTKTKATTCKDTAQGKKCAASVHTSVAANTAKDANGVCHFTAGPKKGQVTKCPA